jgi:hypothetical protein
VGVLKATLHSLQADAMEATSSKSCPRRKFSLQEDQLLSSLVAEHGSRNWTKIASLMGDRSVRQCKERWANYLSQAPDGASWTLADDLLLERLVIERGHKWKAMEAHFPGKTDIQIKNRHNVILRRRKRVFKMAFRRPRGARPGAMNKNANLTNESTNAMDIEVDCGPEWILEDFGDRGSWDQSMGGDAPEF